MLAVWTVRIDGIASCSINATIRILLDRLGRQCRGIKCLQPLLEVALSTLASFASAAIDESSIREKTAKSAGAIASCQEAPLSTKRSSASSGGSPIAARINGGDGGGGGGWVPPPPPLSSTGRRAETSPAAAKVKTSTQPSAPSNGPKYTFRLISLLIDNLRSCRNLLSLFQRAFCWFPSCGLGTRSVKLLLSRRHHQARITSIKPSRPA